MKILTSIFLSICIFYISFAKPLIATSIKPLHDIVKAVGGTNIEVHYIIPPTASVHFYEYRMQDIKLIYNSDIFLYLGVGEANLENLVKTKARGKAVRIIDLKGINLIYEFEFEKHHEKHKKESLPHPALWLDPENAKVIATFIFNELKKLDPEHIYSYQKNYESFIKKLDWILEYGKRKFNELDNKHFISYHYTWPYFTKRFGLIYLDVIELGHGREPTAKHILKIIKEIQRFKIKSIFASVQFYNKRYTSLIKKATNVKVVMLDTFGIEKDYITMLKTNIDKIYENLK